MAEQRTLNPQVPGSSPGGPTNQKAYRIDEARAHALPGSARFVYPLPIELPMDSNSIIFGLFRWVQVIAYPLEGITQIVQLRVYVILHGGDDLQVPEDSLSLFDVPPALRRSASRTVKPTDE